MIVTIFNEKGGVGKTSLSYTLALDLNAHYRSNDSSRIAAKLPQERVKVQRGIVIPGVDDDSDPNALYIYDLGGFIEKGILDLFKASHAIVMPMTWDGESVDKTASAIASAVKHGVDPRRIIVVPNATNEKKLYKGVLDEMAKFAATLEKSGVKVVVLPYSKAISNMKEAKETISLTDLYWSAPGARHAYKNIMAKYALLLKEIMARLGKEAIENAAVTLARDTKKGILVSRRKRSES